MNTHIPVVRRGLAVLLAGTLPGPSGRSEVKLRLESDRGAHEEAVPRVALHVDAGAAPSPWVPVGPFRATWEGQVNVDLRGDYQFLVESSGPCRVEIGGTQLPAFGGTWSEPVRLRKGANPFRAVLQGEGPSLKPAGFRWLWRSRGLPPGPIPDGSLTPSTGLATNSVDARRARGRGLFLELRCARCHEAEGIEAVPESGMDAPRLEAVGVGRDRGWLKRWLLAPDEQRQGARMPRMLHGASGEAEAEALAAWLAAGADGPARANPARGAAPGSAAVGKSLFDTLRCGGCHVGPGDTPDPKRISLGSVGMKFARSPGALAEYLRRPSANYAWSPMPDFGLTEAEAGHLSAWLLTGSVEAPPEDRPSDALVVRGRELAETRGCRACHEPVRGPRGKAPALRELAAVRWASGCVGDARPAGNSAAGQPWYALPREDREALRAFAEADGSSLTRHVPAEFAQRWMTGLRCGGCHEGVEGIPSIQGAGEKLKPEWMGRLLKGELPAKTRPWLQVRMPAYPAYAVGLAAGLSSMHGLPASSPAESPLDAVAAADGRRLVSTSGGFACVSCHAVGPSGATAVFEAPGVNFAWVGERLRPEYFARWIQNPQRIDPGTKMPQYFDEDGNSALADYAGGDGPKTIHALWNYLRLGRQMEPPPP